MAGEPIEGPWTLPEGWRWERLGDLGTWSGGGTPSKARSDFWANGTIPWVSPKDMKRPVIDSTEDRITPAAVAGSATKLVEAGAVLCVMRSGILRHTFPVAVAAVDVTLNQDMRALTPGDAIDASYLAHYLRSSSDAVLRTASKQGTTVNSIESDQLDRHPVPVPPLDVQRRIVARVDDLFADLDDGDALLARARDDLGTWRRALLRAAVSGDLSADWRAANTPTESGADLLNRILDERRARWLAQPSNKGKSYVEPIGPAVDDLPRLPLGWAWASLAQISSEQPRSFQSGPFGSALLHSEFRAEGPLVIGIDNVREGAFSIGREHRISENKYHELSRFAVRPNDVLITVMATIGRTCVVPNDIETAIVSKHLYRITVNSTCVDPYFVMNCLRSHPQTVRYLFSNTRGQTRPGLNKDILESAPIPIASLAEQKWLLCSLNEQSELATGTFDRLDANLPVHLRQSILSAAFRGDLVA